MTLDKIDDNLDVFEAHLHELLEERGYRGNSDIGKKDNMLYSCHVVNNMDKESMIPFVVELDTKMKYQGYSEYNLDEIGADVQWKDKRPSLFVCIVGS